MDVLDEQAASIRSEVAKAKAAADHELARADALELALTRVNNERDELARRLEAEQRAHAETADELARVKASLQRQVER